MKHLVVANRTLAEMIATSTTGLYFKAGAFKFEDALLLSFSDASWANDTKYIDQKVFPRRSQFGRLLLLGDPCLWDGTQGIVHFIGWKSALIKRTCRSTFRAETHVVNYGSEATIHIRVIIASLRESKLNKNWYTRSAS